MTNYFGQKIGKFINRHKNPRIIEEKIGLPNISRYGDVLALLGRELRD